MALTLMYRSDGKLYGALFPEDPYRGRFVCNELKEAYLNEVLSLESEAIEVINPESVITIQNDDAFLMSNSELIQIMPGFRFKLPNGLSFKYESIDNKQKIVIING